MPSRPPHLEAAGWRSHIVQYIQTHPDRPLKPRGLARQLGVPDERYADFRAEIRDLLDQGVLTLGRGRTLAITGESGQRVGVYRAHPAGFGFAEVPGHPDHYVPRGRTGGANDGDTVALRRLTGRPGAPGPRAEVVRILQRARVVWIGVLERSAGHWSLQPRGRHAPASVGVEPPPPELARTGHMVVVEPVDSAGDGRLRRGRVVEVLGDPNLARTQILAVARLFDLPREFPEDVRRAAEQAEQGLDARALSTREDLRERLTVTIDPPDARDFDDAISIERDAHGWELGVHIADVTHFVEPGGPVDAEARRRGTSVYFPGFVVPMLPEALANGACSLQPGKERLTRSVFIRYDRSARVVSARFSATVIRSSARLTYEQATRAIAGDCPEVAPDVVDLLRRGDRLARLILKRRTAAGMISLDLPEIELRFDAQGRVCGVEPAEKSFSHRIIEMFMIEANEAVSRALDAAGVEHLRRVHPDPGPESAAGLARLFEAAGRKPPATTDRGVLLALLAAVQGLPVEPVVHLHLLRSLAQAEYSPRAIGHFALASEHYCHFTSPIRRYPDLLNHRRLARLMDAAPVRPAAPLGPDDLAELGAVCSRAERLAQDAERAAEQALLLQLMKSHVGETFDGMVTGVSSLGAFVRLRALHAEGLVPRAALDWDRWHYDRAAGALLGERTGAVIALGAQVRVRVVEVREAEGRMELAPIDHETWSGARSNPGPRRGAGGRPGRGKRRGAAGQRGRAKGAARNRQNGRR